MKDMILFLAVAIAATAGAVTLVVRLTSPEDRMSNYRRIHAIDGEVECEKCGGTGGWWDGTPCGRCGGDGLQVFGSFHVIEPGCCDEYPGGVITERSWQKYKGNLR